MVPICLGGPKLYKLLYLYHLYMVTELDSSGGAFIPISSKRGESMDRRVIKFIEKLGCHFRSFGDMYHKAFYHDIIENELELAELEKDANIIVVGCGPLPMTVHHLAEKGFKVTGLDRDPSAIRYSRKFLEDVEFILDEGHDFDYSDYDAVWIPFHVEPKDDILCKIFRDIKVDGKVVYRVPRNHLQYFYRSTDASLYTKKHCCVNQSVGRKSIVAVKEKECTRRCGRRKKSRRKYPHNTLKTMKIGEAATVRSCPDHSCLNALGIRKGKRIRMESRQPFGGPLLVSIEDRKVAVDPDIAFNITVF